MDLFTEPVKILRFGYITTLVIVVLKDYITFTTGVVLV